MTGAIRGEEGKRLRSRIFAIGLPIAISGIVAQVQQLIDMGFLGHYRLRLSDGSILLGRDFLSAVGNVIFPYIVAMAFLWSLATGVTILVSQSLGAGKGEEAREAAESAMKYSGLLSIAVWGLWTAFAPDIFRAMGVREPVLSQSVAYARCAGLELVYLGIVSSAGSAYQGMGRTRPEMFLGIFRSCLNAFLDWVLIFGNLGMPEMGAAGAGLATSLSGLVTAVVFVAIVLFSRAEPWRPRPRGVLKAKLSSYAKVFRVGLPTGIEDALWNFGNLVLAAILNRLGSDSVGIYRLVTQIELTPVYFYYGIARAVTTLVGNKTGSRDIEGAKRVAQAGTFYSVSLCVLFSSLFIVFPREILGIFTDDSGLVGTAWPFLIVASVTMLPKCANIVSGNAIRGYGDTKWMLSTQVFGIAYVLSLAWLLIYPAGLGMYGLFIALFLDETTRGIINTVRFYRSEWSITHRDPGGLVPPR